METQLRFDIFDHDTFGSDDPLGEVTINITEALASPGTPISGWHRVRRTAAMKKDTIAQLFCVIQADGIKSPSADGGAAGGAGGPDDAGDDEEEEVPATPNTLSVSILQGRNLLPKDGDTSDPLVVIKLGKNTVKTSVKENTLEPVWNETFEFFCADGTQDLQIICEDDDVLRNEFMGKYTTKVSTIGAEEKAEFVALKDKKGRKDKPRGEIEIGLKWYATLEPPTARKPRKMSVLSSDLDAPEVEMTEEEKEAADKAKEEAEAAQKELMENLENTTMPEGDYQVQVHIIEVRDLKSEDVNGLSDPIVYAECLGKKKHTAIKKQCLNAVFDTVLFFNYSKLRKDEVEDAVIKVSVFDADFGSRNDMIGLFQLDMSMVYYKPHHEVYRQWVGLTDPTNPDDKGLQGYLKLSITVLGPGDKLYVHDLAKEMIEESKEEAKGLDSMLLMPPSVERAVHFLVLRIHEGRDMPAMDDAALGKAGLDAYVRVTFAGNPPLKTKHVTGKATDKTKRRNGINVAWNEELWIPVVVPTMSNKVEVALFDWDRIGMDDRVGTVYLNYKEIAAAPQAPRWYNIYGAPNGIEIGDNKNLMNKTPGLASNYRGRLLISARVDTNESKQAKEETHKKACGRVRPRHVPKEVPMTLRALVISGTELPRFKKNVAAGLGIGSARKLGVCLRFGKYEVHTERSPNVHGQAMWRQLLETVVMVPTDIRQVPDLFIYLYRGEFEDNPDFVSFKRIPGVKAIAQGFDKEAYWQDLAEDKAINALTDEETPGSILMRWGLGSREAAVADAWSDDLEEMDMIEPYELRVNLYQGRSLPAADDDGSIDPFVKMRFAGDEKKSTRVDNATNPTWYETLTMDVNLPPMRFAPRVNLSVWDYDRFSGNDFVCGLYTALDDEDVLFTDLTKGDEVPTALADPKWIDLEMPGSADEKPPEGSLGALLISVQLIKKRNPDDTVPRPISIVPDTETWYLDIICLGLRNLESLNFVPMQKAYLEFDVGSKAFKSAVKSTKASKKPDAANPNFLERIVMPVEVPKNALFAPSLNITLKDTRLGGFSRPVSGRASVPLYEKIPWSPAYKPPVGSEIVDDAFEIDYDDGLPKATDDHGEHVAAATAALSGAVAGDDSQMAAVPEHGSGSEPSSDEEDTDEDEEGVDGDHPAASGGDTAGGAAESKDIADERASGGAGGGGGGEAASTSAAERALASDPRSPSDPFAAIAAASSPRDRRLTLEGVALAREFGEKLKAAARPEDGILNHPELITRDAAEGLDDERMRKFLKKRAKYGCGLEKVLKVSPFESYPIMRGNASRGKVLGVKLDSTVKQVGLFKGIIRLIENKNEPPLFDLDTFLKPTATLIRVYCLEAAGVQPMDSNGKSDPYLKLRLGKSKISDAKNHLKETTEPEFYRMFELPATLPGAGLLGIEMWDYDALSGDDLIGKTLIDLEDRWFDERWREMGKIHQTDTYFRPTPIEQRSLQIPTSTVSQGTLNLWVDFLTPPEAKKYAPLKIEKPPPEKYEVRLIIWRAMEVPASDEITQMNDMYATAWIEGCKKQETDVHWRAKKGKASWNWRMKFTVELPMKFPYLTLQLWDKDITKWSDCIASKQLSLEPFMKKAHFRKDKFDCFGKAHEKQEAAYELARAKAEAAELAAATGGGGASESKDGVEPTAPEPKATPATPAAPDFPTADEGAADAESAALLDSSSGAGAAAPGDVSVHVAEEEPTKTEIKKKKQANKDGGAEDAKAMITNFKSVIGMEKHPTPDDAVWVEMTTTEHASGTLQQTPAGKVLISCQILPKTMATEEFPNGMGRKEPNMYPALPKPVGRMKFSLNPFYIFNELLGPSLCRKFGCCLLCTAMVLVAVFGAPFLSVASELFGALPDFVTHIIIWGLVALTCGCCIYMKCKKIRDDAAESDEEERAALLDGDEAV